VSAQIVGVVAKIGMLVGAAPPTHAPTWDSLLTKVATGTINLVVGVAIASVSAGASRDGQIESLNARDVVYPHRGDDLVRETVP
jgi:hypothetical protein